MDTLNLFRNERTARTLEPGESLFREGEAGDTMFVVLDGELEVVRHDRVIETVRPGGIVGELALIDDGPRSAHAVARRPVTVATVSRERFAFLIQQTPFFALHVMRVLADRLRRTTGRR